MMFSRSSIMVLFFGRDLFPRVNLREAYTHCVQIILKTRFQFPPWVMKNVLFPKVIIIFKLIYLFWFKMKQTHYWIFRYSLHVGFRFGKFLSPFPETCATWLRQFVDSKTLSTPHNGETNRGRPQKFTKKKG